MAEETCDGTPLRYRVECAAGLSVGGSNDLEEAGRMYLGLPGASDILDLDTRELVPPEKIPCVAKAYEKRYWSTQPWRRRVLHFFFPATWND